jgi:DNA polymerase-3 subunit delta
VGERRAITAEDVGSVLTRTKKDPIFEFTNALTDRNLDNALFFLGTLLGGEIHPLQALAATANQVRKLFAVKEFTSGAAGAVWQRGCSFAAFQKTVMPAVAQHDREFLARLHAWEEAAAKPQAEGKKKKTPRATSDLVVARNPANAYPVYILFKKAEGFSREELLAAIHRLSTADAELKSSTLTPRLILERVVWQLCGAQG